MPATNSGERSLLVDLSNGDLMNNSVLREGTASHEVEDLLTLASESAGTIAHKTLALGNTNNRAQVGLARLTELALTALRDVERDNVVARGNSSDTLANALDDATYR
jgi:hypothetical protein